MENNSEILTKKNNNIEYLKKINTLDSTSSSSLTKKLKFKKEMSSLLKFNDNTGQKKSLDFPINFSLFANNIKNDKIPKIEKQNKLKTIKTMKPRNLINLNLNDIIKPSTKKIISRNKNTFNSLSPIKQNKLSFTRFSSPMNNQNTQLYLNKLNYSPINLSAQKNPIIINQIGLSSPIVNLSTKFNNISNSLEQDISIIKNIKGLSINNLNYNINFNNKKIIPSLFSPPLNSENMHKKNISKINSKKKIYNMKKRVQNEIKKFERKINNSDSQSNITKEDNTKIKNTKDNNKKEINNFKKKAKDDNKEEKDKNKSINNKIEIFKKREKLNKNNSVRLNPKSLNEFNSPKKEKYSSNQILYKIDLDLNSSLAKKSQNNNNSGFHSENDSTINISNNNKIENKKENTNDNKAKMDRLIRLKKSSLKHRLKTKNKVVIIEPKKEEINNNKKNNDFPVPPKKKKTNFFIENKKSIYLEEDKKIKEKISRSKSAKIVGYSNKIIMLKLKKNKFYLQINEKKSKNIYSKNKFLKKKYEKLSMKSSNNGIYRKIYVRKTLMLVDMQEKVNNIVTREKNKLKMPDISSMELKVNILEHKIRKNEVNALNFIPKNIFKCNLSKDLYNYIISTTNFSGFSTNITSINIQKSPLINRNKKKTLSRKRFQTVKIRQLSLLNLENEKNENNKEEFSITKTQFKFNNDSEWINSPINLLSIQEIILRSNSFYYEGKNERTIIKRFSTRGRLSHSLNSKNDLIISNRKYIKQLSLGKKFSNIDFSTLKKNIKKSSFNEFSLLYQKKFFKRARTKKKQIKQSKNLTKNDGIINSENSILNSSNEESNNVEDIYFELLSDIIETKNKQFLKCFEKNEKLLDINRQLIEGNTLLIISVREGNFIISKFLCDKGINVNIQNNSGNTALHYAIGSQFYSIADILTTHGAREDIANNKGLYPWDCIENNVE